MLQLLLIYGADPLYQQDPSHGKYLNTCCIIDGPVTEETSLILAICGSSQSHMLEECLNLALSLGCDVNVQGKGGYTANVKPNDN